MSRPPRWVLGLLLSAAWAVWWTYPKWQLAPLCYEWDGYLAASNWSKGLGPLAYDKEPYFRHPPLYFFLLSRVLSWAGDGVAVARAFGCAFLPLQALALAWLARLTNMAPAAGYLAAGLYLASPAALQGALFTDIASDNSLLTLCLLLCLAAWSKFSASPSVWSWSAWAGLVALSFGAKTTTSLALPLALLPLAASPRTRSLALKGLAGIAAGFGLFLLAWWLYLRGGGYEGQFGRSFEIFTGDLAARLRAAGGSDWRGVAGEALRVTLWLSPAWVLLFLRELAGTVRQWGRDAALDAQRAFVAVVVLGYTFLGTLTVCGAFKYSAPALPVLCLLMARSEAASLGPCLSGRRWRETAALLLLGTLWQVLCVGDPLYTLNRLLREEQALGGDGGALRLLAFQLGLSAAPALLLRWRLSRWGPALLLAGACWGLGLDVRQRWAPYRTLTDYGSDGFEPALAFVQERFRGERVLATADLAWRLDPQPPGALDGQVWITHGEYGRIASELRSGRTRIFVFGLGSNTVSQVRHFLTDPEMRSALQGFSERRFGDYWVYERT